MNTPSRLSILAVALCAAGDLTRATAQSMMVVEPIADPTGPVTLIPGQPRHWWFPNVVDPFHPKLVYFEGFGIPLNPVPGPVTVEIVFDWNPVPEADPDDLPPAQTQFSPVQSVDVPAGGGGIHAWFLIPYCPPWVSLQLEAVGGDVDISGVFVHECIPEPGQYALVAGLGMVIFGLARRRWRA